MAKLDAEGPMRMHAGALAIAVLALVAAGPARAQVLPYTPVYKTPSPGPVWGPSGQAWRPSPPAYKSLPQPPAPTGPRPNMAPPIPQAPGFKPFQGGSVYSDRGGVNAYPPPKKPPGAPRSIFGADDR